MRATISSGNFSCRTPPSESSKEGENSSNLSKSKLKLPKCQSKAISFADFDRLNLPTAEKLKPCPVRLMEQGMFCILQALNVAHPTSEEAMFITVVEFYC